MKYKTSQWSVVLDHGRYIWRSSEFILTTGLHTCHKCASQSQSLFSLKSLDCDGTLLGSLLEYAAKHDIDLNLAMIITDLHCNLKMISTPKYFLDVTNVTCLSHLLIKNEIFQKREFQYHCSKNALKAPEIPPAWGEFKESLPNNALELKRWFEENYVNGKLVRVLRG